MAAMKQKSSPVEVNVVDEITLDERSMLESAVIVPSQGVLEDVYQRAGQYDEQHWLNLLADPARNTVLDSMYRGNIEITRRTVEAALQLIRERSRIPVTSGLMFDSACLLMSSMFAGDYPIELSQRYIQYLETGILLNDTGDEAVARMTVMPVNAIDVLANLFRLFPNYTDYYGTDVNGVVIFSGFMKRLLAECGSRVSRLKSLGVEGGLWYDVLNIVETEYHTGGTIAVQRKLQAWGIEKVRLGKLRMLRIPAQRLSNGVEGEVKFSIIME